MSQHPRPSPSPDPFLAQIQSRGINLTDRDRQEGYDVDLVNAQPRGGAGASTSRLSQIGSIDRPAAALTTGNAPIGGYSMGGGEYSDEEHRMKAGLPSSGSYGGITSTDPFLLGAGAADAQMSKRARTKRWILRPLPLAVIIAFICALALALGLGIGLTKERNSDRAAAIAATSGVHTTATPDVSGTVIPSSLWPSTTTTKTSSSATTTYFAGPIATATTVSTTNSTSTATLSITTGSGTATIVSTTTRTAVSPITSIVYASTGDLPIPANTVTTKDGTVYSSVSTNLQKRSQVAHGPGPTTRAAVGWWS